MAKEAELFQECLFSDQSKAMIHVFFGERAVAKIPGIAKDLPLIPIKRAAVVGGGTMGGGITMNYANAGIPVLFKEVYARGAGQGPGDHQEELRRHGLQGTPDAKADGRADGADRADHRRYDKFKEADIVVEAVFEEMALKKKVFAELEKVTRPDAILASNTSTLNIDEIASATSRPAKSSAITISARPT